MRRPASIAFLLLAAFLAACEGRQVPPPPSPADVPPAEEAPAAGEALAGIGQTIYVPVYSHIYYRNERRTINLTATLSIRNTDARASIRITAVRYYDSDGGLVRSHLEAPRALGPMATMDYVVDEEDTSGGSGANFIVEWTADRPVTAPVVEAVMISTASGQGISFTSPGRVLEPPVP